MKPFKTNERSVTVAGVWQHAKRRYQAFSPSHKGPVSGPACEGEGGRERASCLSPRGFCPCSKSLPPSLPPSSVLSLPPSPSLSGVPMLICHRFTDSDLRHDPGVGEVQSHRTGSSRKVGTLPACNDEAGVAAQERDQAAPRTRTGRVARSRDLAPRLASILTQPQVVVEGPRS